MYQPTQNYTEKLDAEIRTLDRLIDDLELRAYREKIEAKLQVYREIGFLRRRREEMDRRLRELNEQPVEAVPTGAE